jgi:hypothetical protein
MHNEKLTRRTTLKVLLAVPLATGVLSACGKKTEPDSCQDVAGLSDADKATRTSLSYTDRAPEKDRHCSVCTYWQPAKDPAECGGCTLVKGPIHPNGFCTAYQKKAA